MKWLDKLLGRPDPEGQERAEDDRALKDLHRAFDNVQSRTSRLERELTRVNAELRGKLR